MFELAQEIVREERGYKFGHGKSRSKKVTQQSGSETPKRPKIDAEERHHRIETLKEQLKDTNKHIDQKGRRIEQAQGIQNYKLCDQLSEEITALKSKRSEIESSLRALQWKDQRSARYFARKNIADTSTDDPSTDLGGPSDADAHPEPFL